MNKKGVFKPFKESKTYELARKELELKTKGGLTITKFYNYYHPEKWFFYRAWGVNLWFSTLSQCINYL